MNYLEKATRLDISFATHQCARFVVDPKKTHARVVRWLGRYLLHSKGKAYESERISHVAQKYSSMHRLQEIGISKMLKQVIKILQDLDMDISSYIMDAL